MSIFWSDVQSLPRAPPRKTWFLLLQLPLPSSACWLTETSHTSRDAIKVEWKVRLGGAPIFFNLHFHTTSPNLRPPISVPQSQRLHFPHELIHSSILQYTLTALGLLSRLHRHSTKTLFWSALRDNSRVLNDGKSAGMRCRTCPDAAGRSCRLRGRPSRHDRP